MPGSSPLLAGGAPSTSEGRKEIDAKLTALSDWFGIHDRAQSAQRLSQHPWAYRPWSAKQTPHLHALDALGVEREGRTETDPPIRTIIDETKAHLQRQ